MKILLGGMVEAVAASGLRTHPSIIARDPNSTPQELLDVVRWQAFQVLQNPALPLMAVENPQYWWSLTLAARKQVTLEDFATLRDGKSPLWWHKLETLALERARPVLLELLPDVGLPPILAYLAVKPPRRPDAPALTDAEKEEAEALCRGSRVFAADGSPLAFAADVRRGPGSVALELLWRAMERRTKAGFEGSGSLDRLAQLSRAIAEAAGGTWRDHDGAEVCELEAQLADARAVTAQLEAPP